MSFDIKVLEASLFRIRNILNRATTINNLRNEQRTEELLKVGHQISIQTNAASGNSAKSDLTFIKKIP
jgi:hypothetical protein